MSRERCLGDVAAALVDGQLDHDARERAFVHLAHCSTCRAEADAQRRLKARLAQLEPPATPPDLAARLLGIAHPTAGQAGSSPQRRSDPVLRPAGRARGTKRPGRRRTTRLLRVATGAVGVGLGAALLLGGGPAAAPPAVDPGSPALFVDHARTTGQVPLSEPVVLLNTGAGAR